MNPAKAKNDEGKSGNSRLYIYATGKRKTAIARVKLFPKGKGEITINDRKLKEYFTVGKDVSSFLAPFKTAEADQKSYDLEIKLVGGGVSSGAEACRHGISRALVKEDETRKGILKKAGFITRDSRSKERKKPGLKRARRSPQWSKR